jgi:hypothetical protein
MLNAGGLWIIALAGNDKFLLYVREWQAKADKLKQQTRALSPAIGQLPYLAVRLRVLNLEVLSSFHGAFCCL